MGLDMYLTARRSYYKNFGALPPKVAEVPEGYVVRSVQTEAVYWRKDNAIHSWFVKNVQDDVDDCGEYGVTGAQLVMLRDLCADLLLSRDIAEVAEKLPPKEGFFFGSYEIDEWYWLGLERTVLKIDRALLAFPTWIDGCDDENAVWDYTYRASW